LDAPFLPLFSLVVDGEVDLSALADADAEVELLDSPVPLAGFELE